MKRIFKKRGKRILIAAGITAATIIAYVLAHNAATDWRGYEAIGGEIFIPFLIIFADDILKIITAPFKAVKKCI